MALRSGYRCSGAVTRAAHQLYGAVGPGSTPGYRAIATGYGKTECYQA
jgi:hypothetical protein